LPNFALLFKIDEMNTTNFDFGMIGLGVMGRNLLLNMADHGFSVIGYDMDEAKVQSLEAAASSGTRVKGARSLEEMVASLSRPRKVMMLVPAGKPVDDVIKSLEPLLEAGDIIIDGGNSHYTDTLRRVVTCKKSDFHFVGIGISGGEHGARTGPSIMPGGDVEAWKQLKPVLEAVAAKVNGQPCVDYMGKDAAGHYVKMVHNGIEYSIMQLICECYDLLHRGAGIGYNELQTAFRNWNEGALQSYLIEITAAIFGQQDDKSEDRLVDRILDKAGAKGTGKWTSQDAMDLGIAVPGIDMAVVMRNLSALKEQRVEADSLYARKITPIDLPEPVLLNQVHDALYCAILISYAQGLALLQEASTALSMDIPLPAVVRVWRGGCIIRSSMLELFSGIYDAKPTLPNLLLDPAIASIIKGKEDSLRKLIAMASLSGYPVATLMSALSYLDTLSTGRLPANLLQAQRDFFGAHTYQRIDMPGVFHTEWEGQD
jgi:6-phosphogluconate dehydrogenase